MAVDSVLDGGLPSNCAIAGIRWGSRAAMRQHALPACLSTLAAAAPPAALTRCNTFTAARQQTASQHNCGWVESCGCRIAGLITRLVG